MGTNQGDLPVHVISTKTLVDYYKEHAGARSSLEAWVYEAQNAHWKSPKDIKVKYPSASFLSDNRVVFNIQGNHFRLMVRVNYNSETLFVKFIGTHAEYDKKKMEDIR